MNKINCETCLKLRDEKVELIGRWEFHMNYCFLCKKTESGCGAIKDVKPRVTDIDYEIFNHNTPHNIEGNKDKYFY
jgi:hypothetical protein